MKGFIASVITMCLLIGAVIFNGIWINNALDDLIGITQEIPADPAEDDAAEKCRDLKSRWEKCEKIIKFSVTHSEIESIGSKITALCIYAKEDNKSDFAAGLAAIENELRFLQKSESFSIDGIF